MSSKTVTPYLTEVEAPSAKPSVANVSGTLFSLRFEQLATAAEVFGDYVAAIAGVAGSYGIYHLLGLGKDVLYPISMVLWAALAFALLFVILLGREGAYQRSSGMLRIKESERILRVSVLSILMFFTATAFSAHLLSRWVLGIGFFILPIAVVCEKQISFSIVRHLHMRGRGVRKAIIYGSGFTGKRVYSALLRSRKVGITPVVFVDDAKEQEGKTIFALGYRREHCASVIHGPITSHLIDRYGAQVVVVAIPSLGHEKLDAVAAEAKEANATLAFVPSHTLDEYALDSFVDIDGIMLASVNTSPSMYLYERTKRFMDLLLSVAALVLLWPIFALLALLVRLDGKGPIFFRQQRVGKNGRVFEMYKFRTMREDAPKYELCPTTEEDPRITRIGRILRKSSLDELPQIFNVLKGEMSLVGPRPEMPFIVRTYGARERQRLSVIPGMTGMWQLSADRAHLIHENLQYDLYYIRNRGFFMDIAILLHTGIFAIKGV